MKKLMVVVAVLVLAGCAAQKKLQLVERIPFPENEYVQLQKTGTASVKGQAFLKTRGGDVKVAAGEEIVLNPVTSYSTQWYEQAYLPQRKLTPADSRQEQYVIKTIGDGSGRFVFKNVPAGEYYLTARVVWESPTGYQGAMELQGGLIAKRIKVSDREEMEIILTR